MDSSASAVWSLEEWRARERAAREEALGARTEGGAWRVVARESRAVMRAYTTSFFIVSRFLPRAKRAEVEAVYAAVRYPDEVVDTFPLSAPERARLLDEWQGSYERGLAAATLREALEAGVPFPLAGFTRVVRGRSIPPAHYRAFLDAMRRDISPAPFETLEELIEDYVYGSAVVVGYFLTHVYDSVSWADFPRALAAARELGIALQLTNFVRDVGEDQRRGRVYLPAGMLREEGVREPDASDPRQHAALGRVVRRVARVAAEHYERAAADLDAFAPDCRLAIRSCINVYGRLNERIARSDAAVSRRESVPLREKFGVLPPSKYWRIPLAYLFR